MSPTHLRPERHFTLPERYRIRRHIASGGMASVWCAEDLVLNRNVAVKVLAERFAHDGIAVRRFKREARAAARVSGHPHVVTVYDVGEARDAGPTADATHAGGRAFIVMEFLAGGTVADAIRHDSVRRHEAVRWLREAASALDHAHGQGIVHRDIKPANFLLDRARVLHVADFGIARLTTEETITSADQLFGTAAYLSPEQALGREATGASDRYALAVAAFELLAGERPFSAPHFSAQARQHIEEPPPAASSIDRTLSPAVDEVLYAGLAKDPAARPASAQALVDALDDALAGRDAGGPPRGPRGPRRREAEPRPPEPAVPVPSTAAARRRFVALAALGTAVLVVAAVALATTLDPGHHRAATVALHSPSGSAGRVSDAPARHVRRRSHTTRSTPAATTSTTAPPTPETLESAGHQELLDGDYASAIPTLQQAVSAAPTDSPTYAYALYDLGRAELESGDPAAAIPILRHRLTIPDAQGVVRSTLDQALAQAGELKTGHSPHSGGAAPAGPSPTGSATTPASSGPTTPAPAPAGPAAPVKGSGGAGLSGPGAAPGPNSTRARGRGHSLIKLVTAAVG